MMPCGDICPVPPESEGPEAHTAFDLYAVGAITKDQLMATQSGLAVASCISLRNCGACEHFIQPDQI